MYFKFSLWWIADFLCFVDGGTSAYDVIREFPEYAKVVIVIRISYSCSFAALEKWNGWPYFEMYATLKKYFSAYQCGTCRFVSACVDSQESSHKYWTFFFFFKLTTERPKKVIPQLEPNTHSSSAPLSKKNSWILWKSNIYVYFF